MVSTAEYRADPLYRTNKAVTDYSQIGYERSPLRSPLWHRIAMKLSALLLVAPVGTQYLDNIEFLERSCARLFITLQLVEPSKCTQSSISKTISST